MPRGHTNSHLLVDKLLSLERSSRILGCLTVYRVQKHMSVGVQLLGVVRKHGQFAAPNPCASLTVRVLNGHLEGLIFGL